MPRCEPTAVSSGRGFVGEAGMSDLEHEGTQAGDVAEELFIPPEWKAEVEQAVAKAEKQAADASHSLLKQARMV